MILESFSTANLSVGVDPWLEATADGYKTASFYQDSSGKSTLDLPLRIAFASPSSLNALLAARCIHPSPKTEKKEVPSSKESGKLESSAEVAQVGEEKDEDRFSFGVEAKVTMTSGSGEAVSATVESVNILSTEITQENVLALETQLVLRVSRQEDDGKIDNGSLQGVRLNLEISAVLSEKSEVEDRDVAASVGLRALYLGRYADLGKSSARRVIHNRLDPINLLVNLSHAFYVSARSMSGPNIGETLISLAISHSNTHEQDVMISNLALHPAFSRSAKNGGQSDQSGAVQWGFAPGAHLKMPLIISPRQGHATILHVLGSSDTGQSYVSPLSVTASVNPRYSDAGRAKSVVAAVQVEWESASQVPSNASDALRVDVTVDQECKVGEPFVVKLRVQNLGQRTASNLKIMLSDSSMASMQEFCILGMDEKSGSDIFDLPKDLLVVDEAIPLAKIGGRESTEGGVRFIALRKGTIHIPHFEIRDMDSNRSFRCVHNVQVVVSQ